MEKTVTKFSCRSSIYFLSILIFFSHQSIFSAVAAVPLTPQQATEGLKKFLMDDAAYSAADVEEARSLIQKKADVDAFAGPESLPLLAYAKHSAIVTILVYA